jgi:hypothetical protein
MKKQKVQLGKKVFLSKETIAALHSEQQQYVLGGALPPAPTAADTCYATCKATCNANNATCGANESCAKGFCTVSQPVATCGGPF